MTLLFPLGQLLTTPGAETALSEAAIPPIDLLRRHATGDWGDLDAEDRRANDHSIKNGTRILSAYKLTTGKKVWIITEADRSATTLLLPSEY